MLRIERVPVAAAIEPPKMVIMNLRNSRTVDRARHRKYLAIDRSVLRQHLRNMDARAKFSWNIGAITSSNLKARSELRKQCLFQVVTQAVLVRVDCRSHGMRRELCPCLWDRRCERKRED